MKGFLICAAVLVLHLPNDVSGYNDGRWASTVLQTVCKDMKPVHDQDTKQTVDSPYKLDLSAVTYQAGSKITVTLSGPTFKGFMLQAREVESDDPIGTFDDDTADTKTFKLLKCGSDKDTVSHVDVQDKTSMDFVWTAPSDSQKEIEFYYTVVQVKATFWVKMKSPKITAVPLPNVSPQMTLCNVTLVLSLLTSLKLLSTF